MHNRRCNNITPPHKPFLRTNCHQQPTYILSISNSTPSHDHSTPPRQGHSTFIPCSCLVIPYYRRHYQRTYVENSNPSISNSTPPTSASGSLDLQTIFMPHPTSFYHHPHYKRTYLRNQSTTTDHHRGHHEVAIS